MESCQITLSLGTTIIVLGNLSSKQVDIFLQVYISAEHEKVQYGEGSPGVLAAAVTFLHISSDSSRILYYVVCRPDDSSPEVSIQAANQLWQAFPFLHSLVAALPNPLPLYSVSCLQGEKHLQLSDSGQANVMVNTGIPTQDLERTVRKVQGFLVF